MKPMALACVVLISVSFAAPASAREYASDPKAEIEEKLGETIPMDLVFKDENGLPVRLGDLIEKPRPTILTLVYFRCPGICSPLMHEVAANVDKLELEPGKDFDLVTISFDYREGPELARQAKKNLLAKIEREVEPEDWRFLTGDKEQITAITDAVGFRYYMEKEDFVHAATVVFVNDEGKIIRYLGGLKLLPADLEMAIVDTMEGRQRSLMQRIQKLCYAYDYEGKTYVFLVNRVVLFVTLLFVGLFLAFLLLKPKRRESPTPPTGSSAASPLGSS